MGRINEDQWRAIALALHREVATHVPEWTSANTHDPGVTLLELFAFLTTDLMYREHASDGRSGAAQRLADAATALQLNSGASPTDGLQRVNYFSGQSLSAEDFTAEQTYLREKLRRTNLFLHGVGVISGLNVSVHGDTGDLRVTVEPGAAVDPQGELIEAPRTVSLALPAEGGELFVQIRYTEQPCNPVLVSITGSDGQQYSRVAEGALVALALREDASCLSLARLHFTGGTWVVDAAFEPRRGNRG
jgi:hypothetical protein